MPVSNNPIQDTPVTQVEENVPPVQEQVIQTSEPTIEAQSSNGVHGLSAAEMNDPNRIRVTISDPKAPLVILFGPPACGKTMTLVRLTRFLQSEGYTVSPIRTFRPTSDTNYADICESFDKTMNSDNAAASTSRISFMLVEVIKNGHRLCQILEAPGEYYFNPQKPNASFPNYVNTIIASSNRKVWTIMVEPDWMDHTDRMNYVTKIARLKQSMRSKDSTIFIFNKIDLTNFVRGVGDINKSAAINEVKNLYPNIFVPFMNQNPITKLFKEYNCDFVPFQTGYYTQALNGFTYQEGPKEYCVKLWGAIMDNIRG
ncbi:MAG: hypothetical protein J6K41_03700 [Paraprevotella sp.]|nr:hypothetical protein [Paraprevotella sp.]